MPTTDRERFIFLAGGIPGEKSDLGNYDSGGCNDDHKKSPSVEGNQLKRILPTPQSSVEQAVLPKAEEKDHHRAIEKSMEMSTSGGKNSFKLVTGDEIQRMWTAFHCRK
jgi:hypothetical protein